MQAREYESVAERKGGTSQKSCPAPPPFERAGYVKTLNSYA